MRAILYSIQLWSSTSSTVVDRSESLCMRLNEKREKDSRDLKELGLRDLYSGQWSCTRDNLRVVESYFVLNPAVEQY